MKGLYNAVVLSLAWFTVINITVSLAAWLVAHPASAWPGRAPGRLLAIRLMPAGAALVFMLAIFAPAHWRFEPRGIEESFGIVLHLLAALGAWMLLRSAWRVCAVLGASRALRACAALPRIEAAPDGMGVYEVEGLAGVSLAGVVRPLILVGPAVRTALTRAELEAAVAHEVAHGAALDNWKRLALFCAPDLFGRTAAARRLEERWGAAAEWQADARAVAGDATRAVHLASALVKVARLDAGRGSHSPAWSTLHDEPLLAARVHRLVSGRAPQVPRSGRFAATGLWLVAVAGLVMAGAAAAYDLHLLTEAVAHALP